MEDARLWSVVENFVGVAHICSNAAFLELQDLSHYDRVIAARRCSESIWDPESEIARLE